MAARRVIDTTRMERGVVRSTRGGLIVGEQRVPLEDVSVLLLGTSVVISGGAFSLLSKYGVVVLNCDWRGIPDMVGYAWGENSRIGVRHRAQAELSLPRRKAAWQSLVKAKVRGQRNNLASRADDQGVAQLDRIWKSVRSGDSTNCEAQAARAYWPRVFDDEGFRRLPGEGDRQNALLNYGYTVLRGHVIRAIASAGLWPTYGLWHRNRSNTFALADDLIEPFRPAVDFVVRELGPGAQLDQAVVKKALVGAVCCTMALDGVTVGSAVDDLATNFALYCEGTHERLDAPVWIPPKTESDALAAAA
jgi:CRISPR-associated protein Cas1